MTAEDEVLAERVKQTERQVVVMMDSMDRITLDVFERVVHPAHVPFVAEAQTAKIRRPRHHRPRGRFLGCRENAGMGSMSLVLDAKKVYRFKVLPAAVHIWNPFALLAAVVQVEH